jgi:hypothetical protein
VQIALGVLFNSSEVRHEGDDGCRDRRASC